MVNLSEEAIQDTPSAIFFSQKGDTHKTLTALLEAIAKVSPTGKQNNFASRAYASYLLAEKGPQQPRSLAAAFLKPVQGHDQIASAITALQTQWDHFDQVYGTCYAGQQTFDASKGEGSLEAITQFITA